MVKHTNYSLRLWFCFSFEGAVMFCHTHDLSLIYLLFFPTRNLTQTMTIVLLCLTFFILFVFANASWNFSLKHRAHHDFLFRNNRNKKLSNQQPQPCRFFYWKEIWPYHSFSLKTLILQNQKRIGKQHYRETYFSLPREVFNSHYHKNINICQDKMEKKCVIYRAQSY